MWEGCGQEVEDGPRWGLGGAHDVRGAGALSGAGGKGETGLGVEAEAPAMGPLLYTATLQTKELVQHTALFLPSKRG